MMPLGQVGTMPATSGCCCCWAAAPVTPNLQVVALVDQGGMLVASTGGRSKACAGSMTGRKVARHWHPVTPVTALTKWIWAAQWPLLGVYESLQQHSGLCVACEPAEGRVALSSQGMLVLQARVGRRNSVHCCAMLDRSAHVAKGVAPLLWVAAFGNGVMHAYQMPAAIAPVGAFCVVLGVLGTVHAASPASRCIG